LTKKYAVKAIDTIGAVGHIQVTPGMLESTLGRHGARAIRCAMLAELAQKHLQLLIDNVGKGDYSVHNVPVFPSGEVEGVGTHEAPRGTLSHWIVVKDGKIKNYQAVVPSTWNASPRDASGAHGPYEASLLHTPLARPEEPLEVLRTVHSFDPCMACACHTFDPSGRQIAKVKGAVKKSPNRRNRQRPAGDDGVGPYVARLLAAHYEFEEGVEVADLGTPALDLIDHFTANDAVILIDSVNTDADPGTVLLYRKAGYHAPRPAVRMDPHSPALVDALLSAELFGVAPAMCCW
jgi:hydrogenase maturation protease